MKVEIEDIPFENRGIEVTSETEDEKAHLESLWSRSATAVMFTRNDDGSVTLTIGPTKENKEEAKREATKRVAELITEFSRCRQERKVRDCEECGLLYHNFADCPLKPEHDEYSGFEMSGLVDIKEAESLLPPEVAEELERKQ